MEIEKKVLPALIPDFVHRDVAIRLPEDARAKLATLFILAVVFDRDWRALRMLCEFWPHIDWPSECARCNVERFLPPIAALELTYPQSETEALRGS